MTQIVDPKPRYSTQTFDCIVALAQSVRATWDTAGLRDAIRKCLQRDYQPTLAEVAYAVVRCAENFTIATPAVIPMDGPHWRASPAADLERAKGRVCPRCGTTHMPTEDHKCRKPTRGERVHEFAELAKRPLQEVNATNCLKHGVPIANCLECQNAREHAAAGSRRAEDTEDQEATNG